MTFVSTILHQIPDISKPRLSFLLGLFAALHCFTGRATMLNLARHGAGSPRRLHRWFSQPFDWSSLNWLMLDHTRVSAHRLAACWDCTFLKKSGKTTWGLGKFHCGVTGRAETGLEACAIGLLDLDEQTAYHLFIQQTPPVQDSEEETRVDAYIQTLLSQTQKLLAHGVRHVVADGYFAKTKVFDALNESGLTLITKLRTDANLRYLYTGERLPGPGRPRLYDGKVDWQDLSRFESARVSEEGVELRWCRLNSAHYKTDLLVVVVLDERDGKRRRKLLCSTDLESSPQDVYMLYKMRFQHEFIFRDGKQFTGLEDGQMRDKEKRHEHLNASLCALNLLRLEDRAHQQVEGPRVISMASWKRRKYAEHVAQRITQHLALNAEQKKILYTEEFWADVGLFAS